MIFNVELNHNSIFKISQIPDFFKNDKNSDNREWSAIQSFGVHYKIQLTLNNVLAVVNYLFFPFTGGKSQLRHEQEPRPGHFELGFEL